MNAWNGARSAARPSCSAAATPEVAQQVLSLQKEAAGVLRAFIQAYSEKVEQDPAAGAAPAPPATPGKGR